MKVEKKFMFPFTVSSTRISDASMNTEQVAILKVGVVASLHHSTEGCAFDENNIVIDIDFVMIEGVNIRPLLYATDCSLWDDIQKRAAMEAPYHLYYNLFDRLEPAEALQMRSDEWPDPLRD